MKKDQSVLFFAVSSTQRVLSWLREHYEFRLNVANHRMEWRTSQSESFRYLQDSDFNSIKVEIGLADIPCSRETLRTVIFSNQWPSYDPYIQWLNNLPEWDGQDHISRLADTVTTDDRDYWQFCFRKWIVAFVGSLFKKDVVNQTAVIFCGKQGIGKSTWWLRCLPEELREYSASGFLQPKDKETAIQLSELCLYDMDEVENLKPNNVEAIKEILTKSSMYLRRAYTTLSNNYPRRCSFCGTANGLNILHDTTGNRRFLCQNVTAIDYNLTGINLDQVYAQAFQLFRTGFVHYFTIDEQKIVEQHNLRFRATSIEEELITTYFEPCQDHEEGAKRYQAHEILTLLREKVRGVSLSAETIGKIMNSAGFVKKKSMGISKWIVRLKNHGNDTTL